MECIMLNDMGINEISLEHSNRFLLASVYLFWFHPLFIDILTRYNRITSNPTTHWHEHKNSLDYGEQQTHFNGLWKKCCGFQVFSIWLENAIILPVKICRFKSIFHLQCSSTRRKTRADYMNFSSIHYSRFSKYHVNKFQSSSRCPLTILNVHGFHHFVCTVHSIHSLLKTFVVFPTLKCRGIEFGNKC